MAATAIIGAIELGVAAYSVYEINQQSKKGPPSMPNPPAAALKPAPVDDSQLQNQRNNRAGKTGFDSTILTGPGAAGGPSLGGSSVAPKTQLGA